MASPGVELNVAPGNPPTHEPPVIEKFEYTCVLTLVSHSYITFDLDIFS